MSWYSFHHSHTGKTALIIEGRTVDNYTYCCRRSNYYGSRRKKEPKLFSHRFHFSHPSTLTLTVTHKDGYVVMYARKGSLYLSITECEFRDLIGSVNKVREKIEMQESFEGD